FHALRRHSCSTLFPYTTLFRSPRLQMCFALQKGELPQAFLTWCKTRKNPQRQLLIFVPTVELAECLAKELALFFKQENIIDDRADRKSTRLNSSHVSISYAVFC